MKGRITRKKSFFNLGLDAIETAVGHSKAVILPQLGGTVYSLSLNDRNRNKSVSILFSDTANEIKGNPLFRGRFLFPFNDRIPGGIYHYKKKEYRFPINDLENGDAIHGFLYKISMNSGNVRLNKNKTCIDLSSRLKPSSEYPFFLEIIIQYCIMLDSFELYIKVINRGIQEAPFAFGWHPYFMLGENQTINDYNLKIPADYYFDVDEKMLPKGNKVPVKNSKFDFTLGKKIGNSILDHAFFPVKGAIILSNIQNKLIIEASPGLFPYFQIYTPQDRKSIAIEPITSGGNAFNQKNLGLIYIKPKKTIKGYVKIGLQ